MKKLKIIIALLLVMSITKLTFSYTRDYDVNDPIDHTLNSKWPAEIREVMADVAERLDDIMNGFTSGDTVTDFNRVPLNNRAADDTAVADTLILYSKDVSSKAELFAIDEDSNTMQITTAGKINSALLSGTEIPSAWQNKVWPVGSIFISTVSTNPNTLLGFGTWASWGAGRVIVGLDSGDGDFDTSEETGGSKTHTLTIAEMPAHTHTMPSSVGDGGPDSVSGSPGTQTKTTGSTGGGAAHTIVQPYIVAYMWERTS